MLTRALATSRVTALALVLLSLAAPAAHAANPVVVVETSEGTIEIELYPDKAPKSVENFLGYVKSGHYSDTLFHRVMPDFMVQGGGYTKDLTKKPTRAPVENEAANGLKNERGTVALARTRVVHSATAQFFVNVKDNPHLDHTGKDPSTFGYAVFGRVVSGMDVVDKIAGVPTGSCGAELVRDCPKTPVVIRSVTLREAAAKDGKPAPKPSPGATPPPAR